MKRPWLLDAIEQHAHAQVNARKVREEPLQVDSDGHAVPAFRAPPPSPQYAQTSMSVDQMKSVYERQRKEEGPRSTHQICDADDLHRMLFTCAWCLHEMRVANFGGQLHKGGDVPFCFECGKQVCSDKRWKVVRVLVAAHEYQQAAEVFLGA